VHLLVDIGCSIQVLEGGLSVRSVAL